VCSSAFSFRSCSIASLLFLRRTTFRLRAPVSGSDGSSIRTSQSPVVAFFARLPSPASRLLARS